MLVKRQKQGRLTFWRRTYLACVQERNYLRMSEGGSTGGIDTGTKNFRELYMG